MKMMFRVVILILFLAGAWGPSFAMGQFSFLETTMAGKPAPDFTLKTLKGPDANMTKFRAGQPAIIFFWATWCPHCREQLKGFNAQAEEIGKKGIKVILVDIGESKGEVQAYVDKNKIMFEIFLDQEETVVEKYAVIGVPTFFFVNAKGEIKSTEHYLPENFEETLKK